MSRVAAIAETSIFVSIRRRESNFNQVLRAVSEEAVNIYFDLAQIRYGPRIRGKTKACHWLVVVYGHLQLLRLARSWHGLTSEGTSLCHEAVSWRSGLFVIFLFISLWSYSAQFESRLHLLCASVVYPRIDSTRGSQLPTANRDVVHD